MRFNRTLIATVVASTIGMGVLTGCTSTTDNSMPSQQQAVSTNIIKSQNDERQYRYLMLDNGLKVVLVSDSKADKSAASMDVHIGHMADPKDREGLTHFLEHMLFLGTEKYPKVGEYNEYLQANGGWSNAGTGQEHTNYFFQVNQDAFKEATDRFAQFFISPTLDPQYVDREKNAVHSEYSMKIKDEPRRINEVLKDTTNQAHPASQFSVGNLTTLADRDNDLLIDDLKEQYKQYYSASRMALSLVGREDLDTLESWAREMFSAIPNNGSKSLPTKVKPFLDDQIGVNISITPLKDDRTLSLNFPVPNSTKYFKQKPLDLLSSLLGHEGKGSLYSHLKEKGYIESLGAYNYGPDDFEMFDVTIELTPKGLENYQEVTESVFSYLSLLNNESVAKRYFKELADISKTNFNFQEKGSSAGTARTLSGSLQYYSPANILNANYLYENYDHDLVMEYISYLKPENMRQVLIAKGLKTDKVQPEYDTPYSMTKLSEKEMARYRKPAKINGLHLPEANPFIAKALSLKSLENGGDNPSVVFEKPGFKLWHKQDTEFRIPKASVNVQIYSDEAGKDVSSRAMNYLYNALLDDSLNEFGYPAKAAGLFYNMWSTSAGMGFGVNGYDEKQVDLLKTINNRIRNLTIDPAAFQLHKDRLIRGWRNAKFDRPYSQAFAAMSEMQRTKVYSKEALADALSSVSPADLSRYIKRFHKQIEMEILVHGNMLKDESVALANTLYKLNMADSMPKERAAKVVKLNQNDKPMVRELAIDHNDSTIVARYINSDKSLENKARYALLGKMISASFFKQIRTDQQLGYIVSGSNTTLEEYPGLSFLIQSPKAGPVELMRRVEKFMTDYRKTLTDMDEPTFADYKAGLVKSIMAKHKNLNERTAHYWSEINDKELNFDSREQMVAQIEMLSKNDMMTFMDSVVANTQPILVRSFGKAHQADDDFSNAQQDRTVCRVDICFENSLKKVAINK